MDRSADLRIERVGGHDVNIRLSNATRRFRATSSLLMLALCGLLLGTTQPAIAQSQPAPTTAPTRIENPAMPGVITPAEAQRMRDRMTALEAENAMLKRTLRDVQVELDRARGAARNGSRTEMPMRAEIPRDPLASPASLFLEQQRRYERDLSDLPRWTAVQLENFKARVEKWTATTNQELHGRSRWLVKFSEIYEIGPGMHEAVVTVLDDATFASIGAPLRLEVPSRYVDRIRSMERARQHEGERDGNGARRWDSGRDRGHNGGHNGGQGGTEWGWELHVAVTSDMKFRPDTPDVGLFNAVSLVGSYVESGMKLEWQGLTDVEIPADGGGGRARLDSRSSGPASDRTDETKPPRPIVRPSGDPR